MFWHPIESTAVRQGYAVKGERRVFMENGTPGIWAFGFWNSYLELNQEARQGVKVRSGKLDAAGLTENMNKPGTRKSVWDTLEITMI